MADIQLLSESAMQVVLQNKQNDIVKLLGDGNMQKGELLYKKELSFAIQACNSNSQLQQADRGSIAKAIWNTAITGLSLNPIMKLAHITPRRVNGVIQAVLMPSYIGLAKLATDTGSVTQIRAHVVYSNDVFEIEYGTETKITHKPKFGKHGNSDIIGAYAIAILKDGSRQFEYMDITEIEGIRERSDSWRSFKAGKANSCIWDSDMGEMCKKTVIKRLCKYLPKSVHNEKWERVMTAVDLDNKDYPADENSKEYARILLGNSTYDHDQRAFIESKIDDECSIGDCEKIIEDLRLNQLNRVQQSNMYSVTDAKEQVHTIIATPTEFDNTILVEKA